MKRSLFDDTDNTDFHEVYGDDGFVGFAHLVNSDEVNQDEGKEDTPSFLQPFDKYYIKIGEQKMVDNPAVLTKRANHDSDFIRLSRSDIVDNPAVLTKRANYDNDFIRLSRSEIRADKKGNMWKILGRRTKRSDGAFVRLSRVPMDDTTVKSKKSSKMWKLRAGKRAYWIPYSSSGNTWYYFRARK